MHSQQGWYHPKRVKIGFSGVKTFTDMIYKHIFSMSGVFKFN